MNKKLLILIFTLCFSACASVENNIVQKEIVIDDGFKPVSNYVEINDNDIKSIERQQLVQKIKNKDSRSILPDKSEVETLIDGFGNKTETRRFKDNLRLKLLVLRTSVGGTKEVTVYGYGSDSIKIVYDLGDKALTASGDEIANAAKLNTTRNDLEANNFTKKPKTETIKIQPIKNLQSSPETTQPEKTDKTSISDSSDAPADSTNSMGGNN